MTRVRLSMWGLALSIALGGCSNASSDHGSAESGVVSDPTCGGRAEVVAAGLRKISAGGYAFELTALDPAVPVQSAGPPGNHWTLSVSDPDGLPVSGGTLIITSYMPDHAHSGPPAVAVERGQGIYEVDALVLPMPALYAITSILTLPGGEKESVVLSLCMSSS